MQLLNNMSSDTNTTGVQNGCHVPSGTYMKAIGTQNCLWISLQYKNSKNADLSESWWFRVRQS